MKYKILLRLFSINIFILIFLGGFVEILFGNWRRNFFSKEGYVQIPGLIKNKKFKYDARSIYSTDRPVEIIYSRDKLGYRSRNPITKKPIILTVGGSTTDNKFLSEGDTWQDILDKKLPEFDFINGGIDGQSSYGHLRSINNWHSKYLDSEKVNTIIFYIGANDVLLLRKYYRDIDYAQTKKTYFKFLLKDNSFFLKNYIDLQNKIRYSLNRNKDDFIEVKNSHSARKIDFLKPGIRVELKERLEIKDYPLYSKLFLNLLLDTKKKFPQSKIIVIQQQMPGCKFINKNIVINRHPNIEDDFCLDLLKTYLIQNKVIAGFPINDLKIFPMYLNEIIKDEDVYDYIHANPKGSKKIANYIESILK
tara:strand:+ start:1671 stop:2759 length:1089 start_codon:yes stop_codon:yes gene_type:complete